MSNDLKQRVQQYRTFELPGQPMATHMGTSYLINDLWKEVKRLTACLKIANDQAEEYERLWYLTKDKLDAMKVMPPSVPDGYMLVPMEPDRDMLSAMVGSIDIYDEVLRRLSIEAERDKLKEENLRLRAELEALKRKSSYCPTCGSGTVPPKGKTE